MKCRKVRRLLPLHVGGDLKSAANRSLSGHIKRCSQCRAEYEAFRASYESVKAWMAVDALEWEDTDWKRTLRLALGSQKGSPPSLALWPFRRVWAYTLMAALAVGLSWLLIRPAAVGNSGGRDPLTVSSAGPNAPEQDVVSMTMISQETGLKIVWFFDKKFNLEENQK
jgi:anti-sigma factor RsiW